MKILQAHNYYQLPGGEDTVVAAEAELLRSRGHQVISYTVHNDAIGQMGGFSAAAASIWNVRTSREVRRLIAECEPDVVHAHNTFPLISPALYGAAAEAGVPVIQTLHNYRLLCPAATFYRDGHICEDCLGKPPLSSVVHACYRGSKPATAVTAAMLATHRALGTFRNQVDLYLALSEFARGKFVQGGLPPEKVAVKPNFLPRDPGVGSGEGGYALFAGRLTDYKGVRTMLEAWRTANPGMNLKIAGVGPLLNEVRAAASSMGGVAVLGGCSRSQVMELLQKADLLVFPSEWYEGMPMSLLEAFACGTPAVVSDVASLDEFAEGGVNVVRFRMGDAAELGRAVRELAAEPGKLSRLRAGARRTYETKFTAERGYPLLMEVYQRVLAGANERYAVGASPA